MGVPVVEHVPGVGQNLQDHLEMYVVQKCKKPMTLLRDQKGLRMIQIGVQWFLNQTGMQNKGFFWIYGKKLNQFSLYFVF